MRQRPDQGIQARGLAAHTAAMMGLLSSGVINVSKARDPIRRQAAVARNRALGETVAWRRPRPIWRHHSSCDCRLGLSKSRQNRLPATYSGLPGTNLRRRENPRRFFQARRTPLRKGDPDLAPYRPFDASALPQGLRQGNPDNRHRAFGRPRERSRHALADRDICRPGSFRCALQRSRRRRPDGTCGW